VTITTGICQTRLSHLDHHLFLNPKLIKSILRQRTDEILSLRQTERAISKIKAQLSANRTAKSRLSGYHELGLITVAILALLTIFQLIDLVSPPEDQPQSGEQTLSN